MKIHLAADHRGYREAEELRRGLEAAGHEVVWHAAPAFDDGDDFPGIVIRAVQAVVADEDAAVASRVVLVARDGAGEVVAANKVNGGRVTIAVDRASVVAARRHADINGIVISLTASESDHGGLVDALVVTPFSAHIDDARRLVNIAEYESSGTIEGWTLDP